MIDKGAIVSRKDGHKYYITFHHPKGNSLPGALLKQLTDEIAKADSDESVNVIVLKSKGDGAFCGGASFDELLKIENIEQGTEFFMGFANLLNRLRTTSKIVIARVQGKTVGGGVGLVSACDYAVAVNAASVKLSELAIGIGPFVVAPAIERKVGKETLSAMTINFEWRSAQWAYSKGLFDELVPDIAELDKTVDELADKLGRSNPEAIRELKKIFWQGTEDWETLLKERAEISGKLVLSEHTRNYINEFRKK